MTSWTVVKRPCLHASPRAEVRADGGGARVHPGRKRAFILFRAHRLFLLFVLNNKKEKPQIYMPSRVQLI